FSKIYWFPMGLIRLLLFILAAWLIWWLLRPLFGGKKEPKLKKDDTAGQVENMVRCAHCGLNLPASEAIREGDLHYCSPQHRDLGPK
ncbi:MAG: hypothetical protein HUJ29_07030, partial [Gammaproteobacteria bacterium]|nr:hypothetical protein [Gammaproteobacteria bacterium]